MGHNRGKRGGRSGSARKKSKLVSHSGHKRKSCPECEERTRAIKKHGQAAARGSSHDHRTQAIFHGQAVIRPSISAPRELLPSTPANDIALCRTELPVESQ